MALPKPPEVLTDRARAILAEAGYGEKAADSLFSFEANRDYLESLQRRETPGASRFDVLRSSPPGGVIFWYRQSRGEIEKVSPAAIGAWMRDPPDTVPGMARVGLDPDGRLVSLLIVPGERTAADEQDPAPAWERLLDATGIDRSSLAAVEPEWAPPVFTDRRSAWTGTWPGRPELPVRVEAAAAGGKPVWLRVILPWHRPTEDQAEPGGFWQAAVTLVGPTLYVLSIVLAAFVAFRNVRRGRGDRRGALRLALYAGAIRMLWFLGAHHVWSVHEQNSFVAHLSYAMQRVGVVYVFYLAIEPYARRLWPHMLVSWVRLLDGKLRDPLVGRDLLIGAAAGALLVVVQRLQWLVPVVLGGEAGIPGYSLWTLEMLRGAIPAFVSIAGIHTEQMVDIIVPMTLLLVFRLLLRRDWLAYVSMAILGVPVFYPAEGGSIPAFVVGYGIILAIFWICIFRFGLLSLASLFLVVALLEQIPLMPNPPSWLAGAMVLGLLSAAAPALWGFWSSRGGRPLFSDEVLGAPSR